MRVCGTQFLPQSVRLLCNPGWRRTHAWMPLPAADGRGSRGASRTRRSPPEFIAQRNRRDTPPASAVSRFSMICPRSLARAIFEPATQFSGGWTGLQSRYSDNIVAVPLRAAKVCSAPSAKLRPWPGVDGKASVPPGPGCDPEIKGSSITSTLATPEPSTGRSRRYRTQAGIDRCDFHAPRLGLPADWDAGSLSWRCSSR
jgi:hypothetical protein